MDTIPMLVFIIIGLIISLMVVINMHSNHVYKSARVIDKFDQNDGTKGNPNQRKYFLVVRRTAEDALNIEVDEAVYKNYKNGDFFPLHT